MGLNLPKKIKLFRSVKREAALVKKFRGIVEQFTRTVDSPIHISDILEPRKGYWQRVSPKPFQDSAIMFFNLGYAGHEYLLGDKDAGSRIEGDLCWSPDMRTAVGIVEVKITTKQTIATTHEELHKYLEQLVAYMALERVTEGEIWVWYVGAKPYPKIAVYVCQCTKAALTKYKKQIEEKAVELRTALTLKDPSDLSLCRRELCYRSKCDWYDECKPEGRWKPKKEEDAQST